MVIFDFDGVIVDSERLLTSVMVECLGEYGVEVPLEAAMRRFCGISTPDCVRLVEREFDTSLPPDFGEWYETQALQRFESELRAIPGVVEVVDRIRALLCIASGSSRAKIEKALTRVGLEGYFSGSIFTAEEVPRGKPAPDLFLHAASTMGVEPDRCVVIEDSIPGVIAARAAHMTVFGLVGSFSARELEAGVLRARAVGEHVVHVAAILPCPEYRVLIGGGNAGWRRAPTR